MCPLENINRKLSTFPLFLFFFPVLFLLIFETESQSATQAGLELLMVLNAGILCNATFIFFGLLCTLTFLSTSFPLLPTILVSTFQLQLCKSQTLIPYRAPLWCPFVDFILRDWQVYSELTLSDISGFLGIFLFLGLFPN